jgi:hypothetical protein
LRLHTPSQAFHSLDLKANLLEVGKQPPLGTASSAGFKLLKEFDAMARLFERDAKVFVYKYVLEIAVDPSLGLNVALVGPNQFCVGQLTSWLEFLLIKCIHMLLFCC